MALAVLAAAGITATPAHADPGFMGTVPRVERAAVMLWSGGTGALPACGKPRYAWTSDLTLRGAHPENSSGTAADADPSACVIRFNLEVWRTIRRERDLGYLCVLLVHELGHLYGQEHSERGVMTPDVTVTWREVPACRRALR